MSCSRVVRPDPLERAEHHAAELPQPHGPEAQRPQARELRVRRRGECVGLEDTAADHAGSGDGEGGSAGLPRSCCRGIRRERWLEVRWIGEQEDCCS